MQLLEEEARRIMESFKYEATLWDQRATRVPVGEINEEVAEGAIAYAIKQAEMYWELRRRAEVMLTEVHLGRGKKRVP